MNAMTPKMIQEKQQAEIDQLKREVAILRSFVIGIVGTDPEGEYRPEFVEQVLKAAQEPMTEKFTDAASFLEQVSKMQ